MHALLTIDNCILRGRLVVTQLWLSKCLYRTVLHEQPIRAAHVDSVKALPSPNLSETHHGVEVSPTGRSPLLRIVRAEESNVSPLAQSQIDTFKKQITNYKDTIANYERKVSTGSRLFKELEQKFESRHEAVATRGRRVHELEVKLRSLGRQLRDNQTVINERNQQIKTLQDGVVKQDEQIRDLNNLLDTLPHEENFLESLRLLQDLLRFSATEADLAEETVQNDPFARTQQILWQKDDEEDAPVPASVELAVKSVARHNRLLRAPRPFRAKPTHRKMHSSFHEVQDQSPLCVYCDGARFSLTHKRGAAAVIPSHGYCRLRTRPWHDSSENHGSYLDEIDGIVLALETAARLAQPGQQALIFTDSLENLGQTKLWIKVPRDGNQAVQSAGNALRDLERKSCQVGVFWLAGHNKVVAGSRIAHTIARRAALYEPNVDIVFGEAAADVEPTAKIAFKEAIAYAVSSEVG